MRRSLAGAVAIALAACGGAEAPEPSVSSAASSTRAPAGLAAVRAAEVVRRTGPEGHAFSVEMRTTELVQYPCTACHDKPVTPGREGGEEHDDVVVVHPKELAASCQTCHDAGDVGRLALQTGETASLDEAYRLCGQCHYSQGDAWAGGGHGKRLVGWRGPRVVMSCTGCHDPHDPTFAKRIPFRAPSIPRVLRIER